MARDSIEQALSVLEAEKFNLRPEDRERLAKLAKTVGFVREEVAAKLEAPKERELTPEEQSALLATLEARCANQPVHYKPLSAYCKRRYGISFAEVKAALEADSRAMYSLAQMENTGGSPDVIDADDDAFVFGDCSAESPARRDLTYDEAEMMAKEFGVDMMSGETYLRMVSRGKFDLESSNWLATPPNSRAAGRRLNSFSHWGSVNLHEARVSGDHYPKMGWRGVLRVAKV